jgi:hypothetical protein
MGRFDSRLKNFRLGFQRNDNGEHDPDNNLKKSSLSYFLRF